MLPHRTFSSASTLLLLLPLLMLMLMLMLMLGPAAAATPEAQRELDELARHFKGCRKRSPEFDACVMKGLNSLQYLFPTGLPALGVAPFDPHHADEVLQRRGGPGLSLRLALRAVDEFGWTQSRVDAFRSDLDKNRIEYSQYFPEKWLTGKYELDSLALQYPMRNRGVWNITLYDYNQTTEVLRPGGAAGDGGVRVRVRVTHIGDMRLHVSNLLGGRAIAERLLDGAVNAGAWRAGLPVFLPLVNDLVSTAFTKIFDDSFRRFPFDAIFPE